MKYRGLNLIVLRRRVQALYQTPLLQWGLWLLALLLIIRFAYFGIDAGVRSTHGFASYYSAARLLKEGADAGRFYDDAWFRAQVEAYVPAASDIYNVNPPATALLLLPLAGLDYPTARMVWTLFNLTCLIGAGVWLVGQARLREGWTPGFIILVLLYQPLYANFSLGQAYVLLLGLTTAAWYGYREQREGILGVALGLMLVLKTAGVLLWVLLLVQRRWRALVWAMMSVLAVGFGSLPWLGLEAWHTYVRMLPDLSARPEMAVTAYQTQLSFIRHLFTFDAYWNPEPLLHVPSLAMWLSWLGLVGVAGFSLYWAGRRAQSDLLFATFVTANVILSPVSLDYHYTLLLVPIVILAAWARRQSSPWPWLGLGIAVILIALDLPYRSPWLAAGVWALLAYPKLYGAWLLWGLGGWACHRRVTSSRRSLHTCS